MNLIVDMSQPQSYDSSGGSFALKRKFEKITGRPCVTMNYPDVDADFVQGYGIKANFITGFGYGWHNVSVPKLAGLSDLMHRTEVPTLGACGGLARPIGCRAGARIPASTAHLASHSEHAAAVPGHVLQQLVVHVNAVAVRQMTHRLLIRAFHRLLQRHFRHLRRHRTARHRGRVVQRGKKTPCRRHTTTGPG